MVFFSLTYNFTHPSYLLHNCISPPLAEWHGVSYLTSVRLSSHLQKAGNNVQPPRSFREDDGIPLLSSRRPLPGLLLPLLTLFSWTPTDPTSCRLSQASKNQSGADTKETFLSSENGEPEARALEHKSTPQVVGPAALHGSRERGPSSRGAGSSARLSFHRAELSIPLCTLPAATADILTWALCSALLHGPGHNWVTGNSYNSETRV